MNEENNTPKEWNEKVKEAIMINTASSIFINLRKMENDRRTHAKRWIWELIQNALDAADKTEKIEINVILEKGLLKFQHNGRPFRDEEIIHLICYGSTKDENDLGQFGTGFLTTHLLSKKVRVITRIGSEDETDFIINRDASTAKGVESLIIESLEKCRQSRIPFSSKNKFTTGYEYEINESTYEIAKKGVRDLIQIAPYVLAFNPIIKSINIIITEDGEKINFINKLDEIRGICQHKIIDQLIENKTSIPHELWILADKDKGLEIALKAKQVDNKCIMEKLVDMPKIFLAFPLQNTYDLPLPIIINSRKFMPNEERNGIMLTDSPSEDVTRNKKLVEEALNLFIKLLSNLPLDKWCDLHNLLVISEPPKKDWLEDGWIRDVIKNLIKELMNVKLVKTTKGEYLEPSKCKIPCFDQKINEENIETLWSLASKFSDFSDKLPEKSLLLDWARIVNGWEPINKDVSYIKLPIDELVNKIEGCEFIADLEKHLLNSYNVYDFLNQLYKFLEELKRADILADKEIFPNQNNSLVKKSQLFKDGGIDEDLKEISKMLNLDAKSYLLHTQIKELPSMQLKEKSEEEIINQLTHKIKSQPLTNDAEYLKANVKMFKWLLKKGKSLEFMGYPVLSCKEHKFQYLSEKEKLLLPVTAWNSGLKQYQDLFPQDYILSSVYDIQQQDLDMLNKIIDERYFYHSPIISVTENIKSKDFSLYDSSGFDYDKNHELSITASDITYLTTPNDKSIMGTIRKSKVKAKKFLKFLFDYVASEDKNWSTFTEIQCSCGEKHKIIPCLWLNTVKSRQWLPFPEDKPFNSSFLAQLIEGDEELSKLLEKDLPINLLQCLGIGVFELKLKALTSDTNKRQEYDRAASSFLGAVKNPEQIQQITQVMGSNPEAFIEEISKTMQEREKIKKNGETGALVENLLKGILENEGFTVTRTGTGSDYLVEYDLVENNSEVIFEVKKEKKIMFYIEIKSTKQNFVKMSYEQAKEASDKKENYVLCALKLDSDEISEDIVKNSIKFVIDIGEQVKPAFDEVSKHQLKVRIDKELVPISDNVHIDVSQGSIYFIVNESAWDGAKNYLEFVEFVKACK